ncbi:hypothetical protein HX049_17440, partial [Myroides odoratimimus]|nr:hypothetical protein [Myroides odoratimimus]
YTNEANSKVTIDVVGDVINNFDEIISKEEIQNNIYESIEAKGKKLLSDASIQVIKGEKALLSEASIAIAKQGVGTEHLKDNAVLSSKIKDGAVGEEKLWAGKGKNKFVAVAQNDGTVKYQDVTEVIQAQALTVDNSLEIKGDASASVLKGVGIQVAENGIVTKHLENKAVTTSKIGSENSLNGSVLTANGVGGAVFTPLAEAITHTVNGDIVGDVEETILVKGGENVLIGEQDKQVSIELNIAGVKEKHIANGAVTAAKLNAENAVEGSVATVGKKGSVSYQPLTTDMLVGKGNIISGKTISATQGAEGSVLSNITLEVNNQSITADKLIAKEDEKGNVATVGTKGVVSYKPLTVDMLQKRGTITTDDIIVASDNGVNKVLENVTLSIKDNSIDTKQLTNNAVKTDQIADLAVTSDKITSGNIGKGRVLLSDEAGKTQWGEMDKIYDAVAGNLMTDDIIIIMPNQQGEVVSGEKALLKDVRLGIKENSISNQQIANQTIQIEKLNNHGASKEGMVMVTNQNGGFDYVDKASIVQAGKDLKLNDGLKFINSNGKSTVLAETSIGIEDQGIVTTKLKDKAVTTTKISSEGAANNAVLTANGDGTVSYQNINENIFTGKGADLKSDNSIKVVANNKALLQETNIAIAEQGVDTKHLKDTAVTTAKISSKQGAGVVEEGSFLIADGQGSTIFSSIDSIALQSGKELKTDTSISVSGGGHALLQEASIQIATSGVQEQHLSNRSVTTQKINAEGETKGLVLLTNGEGGASFETVTTAISDAGKTIYESDAIAITGGDKAVLKDVTIGLKNKGVTNAKIADKTIQAIKIDADQADQGYVLTSLGDGEAKFVSMSSYGQQLDSDASITVSTKDGVLLAPASIKVSEAGITTEHLGDKTVTINKLSSKENDQIVLPNHILLTDGEGGYNFGKADDIITKANITNGETISAISGAIGSVLNDVVLEVNDLSIDTKHLKDNAIVTNKIVNDAVTYSKLRAGSVYGTVVKDKGVTAAKIASDKAANGDVLVADGQGGASFKKAPSGEVDYSKQEQIKDVKWLDTDKKVAQRVFEVELTKPDNQITLDGDFATIILDARFINQTTNSSTRGLIKKEVIGGKTVLTLGTPGTLTVKHPKGKYYLILEYVKK